MKFNTLIFQQQKPYLKLLLVSDGQMFGCRGDNLWSHIYELLITVFLSLSFCFMLVINIFIALSTNLLYVIMFDLTLFPFYSLVAFNSCTSRGNCSPWT